MPLMEIEKNTVARLGGMIDSYSMDQAVKDRVVVSIIYEGRAARPDTWKEEMDREFERDMEGMSKDQVFDYKRRYSTLNKLLTGFNVPNNTVLYMARYLDEHNLLQAIARVNRLFEGKDTGFVIDYVDILGTLTDAINTYSALSGFEQEDLKDDFYEKLSIFSRTLQADFSAGKLFEYIKESDIKWFKKILNSSKIFARQSGCSFTATGNILLNPDLIKHSVCCIDYVIIHELCHTRHPQHNKNFYQLLSQMLPDWQNRKHKLERFC